MTGVNSLPCGWLLPELKVPAHPPLASEAARYVGDPVAVVIAETQSAANDAADLVSVDWGVLPSVTSTERAAQKGTAQIHEVAPDNVAFRWQIGDAAETEAAFKKADVVVKKRIVNQRLVANAMEPRACVARYEDSTGDLTLWVTSQNPHVHRLLMTAFVLGIPEHKVRVIAPDVGGGFGSKIFLYNEETVCSWATRQIKRPIRWTSDRREAFQTDAHGRDHVTDAEVALSRDGKFLGLRVKTTANLGAYLSTFAPAVPTYLYGTLLNGVYTFGAIHCEVTGVFTNTTPVDAYRGAGRPEACYLLERMVDASAAALKMDPAEIRKKNFIPKFDNGFQTKVALTYDSGNYAAAFDRALQMLDYKKFRAEQAEARAKGRLIGVGFSTYIEACSIAPSKVVGSLGAQAGLWESGKVRVHPTGMVTVFTGSHSHGQGHETTFAQLVADQLGIPMEHVDIVHGDTGLVPFGMGTYGSRSASVGGTAIIDVDQQDQGEGQEDRRPSPGSLAAGHRVRQRPVPGEGLAPEGGALRPGRVDRLRAAQLSGRLGAGPRGDLLLRSRQLLLPLRGACLRGGGGSGHRQREDPPLRGGGRCRQRDQPDDRGRHGPRRHRPGRGAGPLGRRGVRRRLRPARDRHHDGLRPAQGRHAPHVRDRPHPDAHAGEPAGHQGGGRDRHHRGHAGGGQRRRRRALGARSRPYRSDAAHGRASLEDRPGRPGEEVRGTARMYPAQFDYHTPGSIKEALDLLGKHKDDAKLLAGGHSLLPAMKFRLARPAHLVDLRKVPGCPASRRTAARSSSAP